MSSRRPLAGVRVVITRATHQATEQRESLEEMGASVFHYPSIAIAPPMDIDTLDASLHKAISDEYDWILLTSTNTVYALSERLRTLGQSFPATLSMRVATVGSSTAKQAQEKLGLSVDVMPAEFTAESLGTAIPQLKGHRVYLPQSELAKSNLSKTLQSQGAIVDTVHAYRTVMAQGGDDVPSMLWEGSIDAITFTSGSTVRNFARRLAFEQATLSMLDDVCVACIGPSTATAAQQLGLAVSVLPEEHTSAGLTDALVTYFQTNGA
ncbi:MAG: uroporphyrinogen-III synthase [Chloroflexota bacterium]